MANGLVIYLIVPKLGICNKKGRDEYPIYVIK
jgi:hypothetical protein